MSENNNRIKLDVMKLISKFDVILHDDNYRQFYVKFPGPEGTLYEHGTWHVRVTLPDQYPFKSPNIVFETQIFHPNIDQSSGTVCLDVLNSKWTPLYDLLIVFSTFLPQLLRYPVPHDPLNRFAAMILLRTPDHYENVVAMHVSEHANATKLTKWYDESDEEELSELSDSPD